MAFVCFYQNLSPGRRLAANYSSVLSLTGNCETGSFHIRANVLAALVVFLRWFSVSNGGTVKKLDINVLARFQ